MSEQTTSHIQLLDRLRSRDELVTPTLFGIVGLQLVDYSAGRANLSWTPTDHWAQDGRQSIFGGAAAVALEYAYRLAMASLLRDDEIQVAVRLETDYVRPVRLDQQYTVSGEVQERAGSTLFVSGAVTSEEDEVAVLGSGVCRAIQSRSER